MIFVNNPNGIEGTLDVRSALISQTAMIFSIGKRKTPMTAASRLSASSLKTLREEAADCRACHLWKGATQTVFGEGPQQARIMLVGEEPGDKEDLAGKPLSDRPARSSTARWRKPASIAARSTSPMR
jgi:DNA polymerase